MITPGASSRSCIYKPNKYYRLSSFRALMHYKLASKYTGKAIQSTRSLIIRGFHAGVFLVHLFEKSSIIIDNDEKE